MIIAFDGNVFVGKTTLIKELSLLCNAHTIDEQGLFLEKTSPKHFIEFKQDAISLQLKYFNAETRRVNQVQTSRENFLDRSFVSMAAHVSALYEAQDIDIREWFLKEMEQRLYSGEIIIPDIFCFLKCSHKVIRKRILLEKNKSADSVYCGEKYLTSIENFNQRWIEKTGGKIIDTETNTPIRLAKNLLDQRFFSSQGKLSPLQIMDFLRDTLL